ncbi:reverse transcriptase N-terminal domain-containing protein [Alcaligenaceae bacterium]|nr:reverse transcriptase N-terminal domain-containing protein [Alcaligenaceae bacterium]
MTAVGSSDRVGQAGAPATTESSWRQIDWGCVEKEVWRLQARIAKATRVGRWNKVRALQHLLTRLRNGKLLAVKRVTDNAGKRTAGVDGQIWSTPQSKLNAVRSLKHRGYQPQALWQLALIPVAETTADTNSYGFRPKRAAADAIEHCFIILAKKSSASWVLEEDIKGCFDNISHDWLLKHVPMDKVILRKWLKAGTIEDGVRSTTEKGAPQGGLCAAEHNPPYEQCWVMHSVPWQGLVVLVPLQEHCA